MSDNKTPDSDKTPDSYITIRKIDDWWSAVRVELDDFGLGPVHVLVEYGKPRDDGDNAKYDAAADGVLWADRLGIEYYHPRTAKSN